ncbi:MAG: guanylate kinase [Gemmatimonadaceae bacterium]|nr:guanylate kinase [Gemmatimonadaceae bacterium]
MSRFPIILSAPSGAGKTTIARRLLAERTDLGYSVSATTRPPRPGEVDAKDYHFRSTAEFEAARERGEFAESANVHGHLYGTLKAEVDRVLSSGQHVVMDIDVQGAKQFAAAFPQSVLIFIVPPSISSLVERLKARATEDSRSLARRLSDAQDELQALDFYKYVVVNDDLDTAIKSVSSIIDAESLKRTRGGEVIDRVQKLLADLEREIGKHTER